MSELETAQKRIADLEEELAEVSRQLAVLTRYGFGKRSEPEAPEGRRQTATQERPAGRTRWGAGESADAGPRGGTAGVEFDHRRGSTGNAAARSA